MTIDALISKLEGVKRTAPGRWSSRCPAHNDRRPSLSIRELDDGRILLHDFAGCQVQEVLNAIGMSFEDLYPSRTLDPSKTARSVARPWRVRDLIEALEHELLVGLVVLADVARGAPISDEVRHRAGDARRRIAAFLRELQNAS